MDTQPQPDQDGFRRISAGVLLVGLMLSLLVGWFVIDSRRAAWSQAAATATSIDTALGYDIARTIEPARNGVPAGLVDYTSLATLFTKFDPGPGGTITLFDTDGTLLYRAPRRPADDMQAFGADTIVQHLRTGQTGPYDATSPTSGMRVLVAASRIEGVPLILSVELPLATVYAGWTVQAMLVAGVLAVLLATGSLLLRAMRRQQQARLLAERRAWDMSEQNRRDAERYHASKMEAVGRLTAGVAHDFNNYLQTITSSLEIISADYLVETDALEIAQVAHKAAAKGAKLTHRLLSFSRQQVLQPQRVGVTFLLGDMRKLIADARIFRTELRCKLAVEPFTNDLHVDPTQIESCLLNLLINARDAMPEGGTLHLQARNASPEDALFGSLTPGRHVILSVRDTGRGMDEATRSHAFEPFFTTKAFGTGAGLGLSMALGFCHQSGGDIRLLSNTDGPGTTVELWLPAAPSDAMADDEIEVNYATIGRRTGRILLVEDEQDVLVTLSAILISGGFEVVSVNNGAEGLMRLHDREPFDAVLTDHHMPDMSGADFLARVAAEMPGLPMLILSGGGLTEATLAAIPRKIRVLRKPIRRMGLLNAVREAIGERSIVLAS